MRSYPEEEVIGNKSDRKEHGPKGEGEGKGPLKLDANQLAN
jgi:hypothetical protein